LSTVAGGAMKVDKADVDKADTDAEGKLPRQLIQRDAHGVAT